MREAKQPRRGRPSISPHERSTRVCFAIPNSEYDELYAAASEQRKEIPDVIRDRIRAARELSNQKSA